MRDRLILSIVSLIIFVTQSWTIHVPQPIHTYPRAPIWSEYLADPFAFKFDGKYYIIGTGLGLHQGNDTFPSLISIDFVQWNYAGDILIVNEKPNAPYSYLAPEIVRHNDRFYLFYSAGFQDRKHRLRVASSHTPLGPFNDSESIELTDVNQLPFAIDPHPFQDQTDGQWYLFYSRDFLDTTRGYRVGTGVVVDRLFDNMTRLFGNETVVLRAKHDWQLYQPNRHIYNQTFDWYTLEGATVWQKNPGIFICFYSGGNWQETSSGVDYGIAFSSPWGPYDDDSTSEARITHSIQGEIIGPGHNSLILGPDRQTTYIVYHAWDETKTKSSPYISRLTWETRRRSKTDNVNDLLLVTVSFFIYVIFVLLIFHRAL